MGFLDLKSMRWKIIDKEEADQYDLKILEVGSNTLLEINLKYMPYGMSIEDYVEWIQKEGIALKIEDNETDTVPRLSN